MRRVLLAVVGLLCCAPAAADAAVGEIVVRYAPGTAPAERAAARGAADARVRRRLEIPRAQVLVADDRGQALRRLRADPAVELAAPNRARRAYAEPSDPRFGELGGLQAIRAPLAWDRVATSPGVVVAVVDDGIAPRHEDLAGNLWTNPGEVPANGLDDDGNGYVDDVHGGDAIDFLSEPGDWGEHGTHVAGTLGAVGNNAIGTTGVAWDVQLMSVRALDALGDGDAAGVAEAFEYAAAHGAHIVNASLGGDGPDPLTASVIADHPDVLFVAAAGNDAVNNDSAIANPDGEFPCNHPHPNVICVAATDETDALADFSNIGPSTVDIAAPGVDVLSTVPGWAFSEGFEDGPLAPTWGVEGTAGTWGLGEDSQGFFASDSPAGPYPVSAIAALTLATPVPIAGLDGCRLEYLADWMFADAGDSVTVEQETAEGEWVDLHEHTGTSEPWEFVLVELDPAEQDEARIRFVLRTNGSGSARGLAFDDLLLRCDGISEYLAFKGTSMATPHVAGAAALLMSADPGARGAELGDTLVDGAAVLPSLVGQVASDGRLDVVGALDRLALPYATTGAATDVTTGGARLTGSVDPRGAPAGWHFEWGQTTAYGQVAGGGDAGSGEEPVAVGADLAGLAPSTTYHYRLVSTSGGQSLPGRDRLFTTAPAATPPGGQPPVVQPPDTPPKFGADAKARCKLVRVGGKGVARCRVRAAGAERARFVLRRRGRAIATGRGRVGRYVRLRAVARRKVRPGRHRLSITLFGADDAKAKVKRTVRLRR